MLLLYVVFKPALYPPVILHLGHRIFVSVFCLLAMLSLFPLLRTPSPERRRALVFLVIPVLSILYVLYDLFDWFYG